MMPRLRGDQDLGVTRRDVSATTARRDRARAFKKCLKTTTSTVICRPITFLCLYPRFYEFVFIGPAPVIHTTQNISMWRQL